MNRDVQILSIKDLDTEIDRMKGILRELIERKQSLEYKLELLLTIRSRCK